MSEGHGFRTTPLTRWLAAAMLLALKVKIHGQSSTMIFCACWKYPERASLSIVPLALVSRSSTCALE
jgi:hypothetical protein